MTDLAERLRPFPLFSGLGAPALARLASSARLRTLDAGQPVFRQGDDVRGFFAVLAGGVRVVRLLPDGRERVIQRIRAGQTFAEAAVLSMPRYPASAIATATPTELAEIGAREFTTLVETDRDATKAIIASLSSWLVQLVGRVEELTTLSADARVARYLLDLPSRPSPKGLTLHLQLAKKDLAAHLAITPETLSRVLRRWREAGTLTVRGADVTVLDTSALVAAADE